MLATLVPLVDAFSPQLLPGASSSPAATMRRHSLSLMDAGEAERKQRLQQLFGDDFKDGELSRVSPTAQLNERPAPPPAPAASVDDDELAGRRVRKQQSTSELAQLMDIGARFEGLQTLIAGVSKGSLGSEIAPGRICIARRDLPSKYIVVDQAYEVTEVYYQGMQGAEIERIPVANTDAPPPKPGYVQYLKVFSEEYHTAPVIVRPDEIGLVSLGTEVVDSLKIALPILGGWLTVIFFLLSYGDATK